MFQGGRKEARNENPGPGQYSESGRTLTHMKTASTRFGSTKRPDIWEKDTQNDQPGPGNYVDETNTFGKAARGVATMGSKYKPETNSNPGPGQYVVNDSPTKQNSKNVRISRAERQDLWKDQTNDQPGPGNYAENTSSFAQIKGGAANMGSKHREEVNYNPGPGQYEQALYDMSNHQSTNVKIGTQKIRTDLFSTENGASNPGPGAYESPSKKVQGFVISTKQETKIEQTPGPGNYNTRSELTHQKEKVVKISQAKREDLWKESTSKADMPGPGAGDPHDPAWVDGGFHFDRNERFPKQSETAPGPGTYELLDD